MRKFFFFFRIYQEHYGLKWYQNVFAKIGDALLIRKCLFEHLAKRGIQVGCMK